MPFRYLILCTRPLLFNAARHKVSPSFDDNYGLYDDIMKTVMNQYFKRKLSQEQKDKMQSWRRAQKQVREELKEITARMAAREPIKVCRETGRIE